MNVTDILTPITSVVTAAVGWAGTYLSLVTSSPLLLLFVLMSCGLITKLEI